MNAYASRLVLPGRSRLLAALLVLTAVAAARFWWVPVRCLLDERTFQWSAPLWGGTIGGQGLGGAFPVLILLSAYLITMLALGWRGGRGPFAGMALVWYGVFFAGAVRAASGGGIAFYADGLGLRLDITGLALGVNGLGFALAAAWALRRIRDAGRVPPPGVTAPNARYAFAALALVPTQAILFQVGPAHDFTDTIALGLTLAQWALLNAAWALPAPEGDRAPV